MILTLPEFRNVLNIVVVKTAVTLSVLFSNNEVGAKISSVHMLPYAPTPAKVRVASRCGDETQLESGVNIRLNGLSRTAWGIQ